MTEQWWLWAGQIWDVDSHNHLTAQGVHFELYAVCLEDDIPVMLAGPVTTGAGPCPGPTSLPPRWPTGNNGTAGKRKWRIAADCPFLDHPLLLQVLITRRQEFTTYPRSDTFMLDSSQSVIHSPLPEGQ